MPSLPSFAWLSQFFPFSGVTVSSMPEILPFDVVASRYANSDCGNAVGSTLFFFTFYVFTYAVFLNLYVAAILDTYSTFGVGKAKWQVKPEDMKQFQTVSVAAAVTPSCFVMGIGRRFGAVLM